MDKDLSGYEACLAYHGVARRDWRCTMYPFAGNATRVRRDRLTFVGLPDVLMFREDLFGPAIELGRFREVGDLGTPEEFRGVHGIIPSVAVRLAPRRLLTFDPQE